MAAHVEHRMGRLRADAADCQLILRRFFNDSAMTTLSRLSAAGISAIRPPFRCPAKGLPWRWRTAQAVRAIGRMPVVE
jgi:hypothetical protein